MSCNLNQSFLAIRPGLNAKFNPFPAMFEARVSANGTGQPNQSGLDSLKFVAAFVLPRIARRFLCESLRAARGPLAIENATPGLRRRTDGTRRG